VLLSIAWWKFHSTCSWSKNLAGAAGFTAVTAQRTDGIEPTGTSRSDRITASVSCSCVRAVAGGAWTTPEDIDRQVEAPTAAPGEAPRAVPLWCPITAALEGQTGRWTS
jgi:hypothetical protein